MPGRIASWDATNAWYSRLSRPIPHAAVEKTRKATRTPGQGKARRLIGSEHILGEMPLANPATTHTVIRLTVDGRAVEVPAGATVLDAVNRLGIPLPQLCKDPDRPPLGACRTCLVQVEGQRGFPAACHLPAREGLAVRTDAPDVVRLRRGVLDLTRSMLTAGDGRDGFGQVGEACARHGLATPSFAPLHRAPVDDS